jgi:ubiquinone/menaquinone biosynthesis C-methylase UbiE
MQRAGIKPGMNVLDWGCGARDVSFLVAALVGSLRAEFSESTDLLQQLSRARERQQRLDFKNVSFEVVEDLASFTTRTPVDAVVGNSF